MGFANLVPLHAWWTPRFSVRGALQRAHNILHTTPRSTYTLASTLQSRTYTAAAIVSNEQQQKNKHRWNWRNFSMYTLLSGIGLAKVAQQEVFADENPQFDCKVASQAFQDYAPKNFHTMKHDERIKSFQNYLKTIVQAHQFHESISWRYLKNTSTNALTDMIEELSPKLSQLPLFTIFSNEAEYADKYEVFYHAHPSKVQIVQDLFGAFGNFLHNYKNKNFIFLRNPIQNWHQKSYLSPQPDEYDLSQLQLYQTLLAGSLNDMDTHIQSKLLSVNIHLFANANEWMCRGSSTLNYYANNTSASYNNTLIIQLLEDYDFIPHSNFKQIIQNSQQILRGNLLQIFIPKTKVDNCVYMSHPLGQPFCDNFKCISHQELSKCLGLNSTLPNFYRGCGRWNFYCPQARIILDHNIMLNPNSGVKIFRYTQNSPETEQQYQQQFKQAMNEMFIEWLERMKKNGVKQEALERINKTELGKKILQRCWRTGTLIPQIAAIDAELATLRQSVA